MKKFKFSLQTVHNVREMRQENEEMKLIQLQSEANQILEQIAKLEKMHHEAIENYAKKLGTGVAVNISAIKYELDQISALENAIRNAQLSHAAKKSECKAQSLKLAEAMREVKTTDRLRPRSKDSPSARSQPAGAGFSRRNRNCKFCPQNDLNQRYDNNYFKSIRRLRTDAERLGRRDRQRKFCR